MDARDRAFEYTAGTGGTKFSKNNLDGQVEQMGDSYYPHRVIIHNIFSPHKPIHGYGCSGLEDYGPRNSPQPESPAPSHASPATKIDQVEQISQSSRDRYSETSSDADRQIIISKFDYRSVTAALKFVDTTTAIYVANSAEYTAKKAKRGRNGLPHPADLFFVNTILTFCKEHIIHLYEFSQQLPEINELEGAKFLNASLYFLLAEAYYARGRLRESNSVFRRSLERAVSKAKEARRIFSNIASNQGFLSRRAYEEKRKIREFLSDIIDYDKHATTYDTHKHRRI
ncbi:hypothetical protein TWF694_005855 [Orbilia ellipsospora]|uniref:Uncharacterized protein n=1 Tax=Orbilia ellipsospora TaxID=2528407 RepID=A0AAV9WS55_9PEZI